MKLITLSEEIIILIKLDQIIINNIFIVIFIF